MRVHVFPAPIDETSCPSKIGSQLTPPSVVLKMPPDADPAYTTSGSRGTPATALTRFPSGPT
ncbi:MAG: hypothetical protein DMF85_04415 [Acidobacteria bacterium]|nr:MAG: hypothetical protein DMF85_04415 [Acidobacteriota bacterium]